MSQDEKFEGWGVVEMLGHRRLAGHVGEQTIAGSSLVRVGQREYYERNRDKIAAGQRRGPRILICTKCGDAFAHRDRGRPPTRCAECRPTRKESKRQYGRAYYLAHKHLRKTTYKEKRRARVAEARA